MNEIKFFLLGYVVTFLTVVIIALWCKNWED